MEIKSNKTKGGNNIMCGCKGICTRYKAQKPVGLGRYASQQRRCQRCEIFINWVGSWCPCCGYRLRTKPRNLKYKAKLRKEQFGQKETELETVTVDGMTFQRHRAVKE